MATARYIPPGYSLIASDARFGFEVYRSNAPGCVIAMAFGGKRSKPDWHFRFQSEERLAAKIAESLAGFEADAARTAAYKAERNKEHDVKVGDVFRCSWGYDQTNVDYYQCTDVSGSMIQIREIGAMSEETEFMQGRSVPALGKFIGEPMRKKVSMLGGEPSVRIYSYASAYRVKPVADVGGVKVFASDAWTAYA